MYSFKTKPCQDKIILERDLTIKTYFIGIKTYSLKTFSFIRSKISALFFDKERSFVNGVPQKPNLIYCAFTSPNILKKKSRNELPN